MYYKFVWEKAKRKWLKQETPAVETAQGVGYTVLEDETPVIEVYIDENDDFITYYCDYKEPCLAVRTRPQGLLGVQTYANDTRLSDYAKDQLIRDKFPDSPVTTDEQATWGTGIFNLEEIQ